MSYDDHNLGPRHQHHARAHLGFSQSEPMDSKFEANAVILLAVGIGDSLMVMARIVTVFEAGQENIWTV